MSAAGKVATQTRNNKTKPTVQATAKKVAPTVLTKPATELKDKKITATGTKSKIPSTTTAKPSTTKITGNAAGAKTTSVRKERATQARPIVAPTKANVERKPSTRTSPSVPVKKKINAENNIKVQKKKPNSVLDTPINVTVTTPPMQRKIESTQKHENDTTIAKNATDQQKRKLLRKGSRTLEPDEILVLRRESAKKRFEEVIRAEEQEARRSPIRSPVAFEVKFDETLKPAQPNEVNPSSGSEQADYSDDYESSFSSPSQDSSTQLSSDSSDSEEDSPTDSSSDSESKPSAKDDDLPNLSDDDEESQVTPYPSTVIFRERKLDSGHYEMNSQKTAKHSELSAQSSRQQFDSLDTISVTRSEHFDSGISNYSEPTQRPEQQQHKWAASYGGYVDFNTRPIINKRGLEIMAKIRHFDTISYTLFELKPTSYEVYMQLYGNLNTAQSTTQTTFENRMSRDCQTDDNGTRNIWTQHPALYDTQTIQRLAYGVDDNGALPVQQDPTSTLSVPHMATNGDNRARRQQLKRGRKPFAYDRLNGFLLKSSMLISKVFDSLAEQRLDRLKAENRTVTAAQQRFKLNTQMLNALRVVRVFASTQHNTVITVHESEPDAEVYRYDFSHLLMVWSSSECTSQPIRLLSTWSEVCRAEICNDSADIVVCGLRDGSVALWNMQETYSYCSQLDGCLTHFAATHSIVPAVSGGGKILDLGAAIDVKSFRSTGRPGGVSMLITTNSIQFVSLHDCGMLTVWTLVKATAGPYTEEPQTRGNKKKSTRVGNTRFEYSSPWASVKLMQSASCDLRSYLEQHTISSKSHFEKTRALFQRNISNDSIRQKLSEAEGTATSGGNPTQGLRFTGIDVGDERLYVCTNRNFVLACSRSLKIDRFLKIAINDSRFLFLTAICVLANEDFLAVGLTNGSVMIVNCSQRSSITAAELIRRDAEAAQLLSNTLSAGNEPTANEFELETGKSCAIQNIILSENRSMTSVAPLDLPDAHRPMTAPRSAKSARRKRYAYEVDTLEQQLLLSGSDLRANLVQSLQLAANGERLFVLANRKVRSYDFCADRECAYDMRDYVADMAVTGVGLLLLSETENAVEVHLLNQ